MDTDLKKRFNAFLADPRFIPQYQVDVMGSKVDVPVVYTDSSAFMSFFPISIRKAKSLLPSKRFVPISILGGKCLLGITVFDYINCPVGPYREIALSIPVTFDSLSIPILPLITDPLFGKLSFYTIALAMTTNISREHSKEIFGYPTYEKNIAINLERERGYTNIDASEGPEKILSLKVKSLTRFKTKTNKFNTYYINNDKIMRTVLHAMTYEAESAKKQSAILELGDHEIAKMIRSLSVDTEPVRTIQYTYVNEVLGSPEQVGTIV